MNELKPCPFCGGEVEISPEAEYVEIVCDDCHLSMWAESYKQLEMMWERRQPNDSL